MVPPARLRRSSRVLLMSSRGSCLLFNTLAPDSSGYRRWITPGGGLKAEESHERAAQRELFEETGRKFDDIGQSVWKHQFNVTFDRADHNQGYAEFFLVRTEPFDPVTTFWTQEEHLEVSDWGWFTAEQLIESEQPYEPTELPDLMRRFR